MQFAEALLQGVLTLWPLAVICALARFVAVQIFDTKEWWPVSMTLMLAVIAALIGQSRIDDVEYAARRVEAQATFDANMAKLKELSDG